MSSAAAAATQAQLLVKTVTSYHVRVLKFSPFKADHFVSAGRDSIRCYRMKGDDIRGISIKMQVCPKWINRLSQGGGSSWVAATGTTQGTRLRAKVGNASLACGRRRAVPRELALSVCRCLGSNSVPEMCGVVGLHACRHPSTLQGLWLAVRPPALSVGPRCSRTLPLRQPAVGCSCRRSICTCQRRQEQCSRWITAGKPWPCAAGGG